MYGHQKPARDYTYTIRLAGYVLLSILRTYYIRSQDGRQGAAVAVEIDQNHCSNNRFHLINAPNILRPSLGLHLLVSFVGQRQARFDLFESLHGQSARRSRYWGGAAGDYTLPIRLR